MIIKKVAVIIPFYSNSISEYELVALEQCFKVLVNYPIIAIKPNHLTLPAETDKYKFYDIVSFGDDFFKSVEGYNALMLSADFYKTFLGYEYMLIHQLDAFVFEDKLNYWCDQNYDYIGAPWLRDIDHPDLLKALKSNFKYYWHTRNDIRDKNGEPTKYQYENRVGNGGFSLRHVQKFYEVCLNRRPEIEGYLKIGGHHFNEDRFFSVEVNRKRKFLNIPNYKTGVKFSFELVPERALRINNGQLPFGCHAWDRYVDFWRPIFKPFGYKI